MNSSYFLLALFRAINRNYSGHAVLIWHILITFVSVHCAFADKALPSVILVDKKTNKLIVAEVKNGDFVPLNSYKTTLGKVQGDKEVEGDLKTPEGFYLANSRQTRGLPDKLGVMAFGMDYPNSYDLFRSRTGRGIMLHATNDPTRLEKDFDSEGCIVLKNEEIKLIDPKIRPGLTPIIVYSELTEQYRQPHSSGLDKPYREFFEKWVEAWESKTIDNYISHYHSRFTGKNMNVSQWKDYKQSLNKQYETIRVNPSDLVVYPHPKYTVLSFKQNYVSTRGGGKTAFTSQGTKFLYLVEENGAPRILAENITSQAW